MKWAASFWLTCLAHFIRPQRGRCNTPVITESFYFFNEIENVFDILLRKNYLHPIPEVEPVPVTGRTDPVPARILYRSVELSFSSYFFYMKIFKLLADLYRIFHKMPKDQFVQTEYIGCDYIEEKFATGTNYRPAGPVWSFSIGTGTSHEKSRPISSLPHPKHQDTLKKKFGQPPPSNFSCLLPLKGGFYYGRLGFLG